MIKACLLLSSNMIINNYIPFVVDVKISGDILLFGNFLDLLGLCCIGDTEFIVVVFRPKD